MNHKYDLIEIHTDGGSRGNPGPAGIGAVAKSNEEIIFTISEQIGITTNNVAEYTAVIRSLQEIEAQSIFSTKVRFVLDSELIVKQITGLYKVKQPHLQELRTHIIEKIKDLRQKGLINQLSFLNVLREKNKEADKLVNLALDSK